jgi:iron complex transport system permease protein
VTTFNPSRTARVCVVLVACTVAAAVLSIGTGDYPLTPSEVVRTLVATGPPGADFIVQELRLPRVVCAVLVGGALGASGAVFQTLTRNPLGSPDVIGFSAGAATGAVLHIALLGGASLAVAGSAITGGILTAIVVYGLAFDRGSAQGSRLILIGIGVSALLAAVTTFVIARADLGAAQAARVWLTGSLNGRGWSHVVPLAACAVAIAPVLAAMSPALRQLQLGQAMAASLGVAVRRIEPALIVTAVALTGAATATAGPIPFVALAAPQLAKRLTRASGPGLIAASVMGALLLTASDLAAQRFLPTGSLPVGVVTGALGGSYLIWLLTQEWRRTA